MGIELLGTIAFPGYCDSLRWPSHVPERMSRKERACPHLLVFLHVQRNPVGYQFFVRFSEFLFDLFWLLFIFVIMTNKNLCTIK